MLCAFAFSCQIQHTERQSRMLEFQLFSARSARLGFWRLWFGFVFYFFVSPTKSRGIRANVREMVPKHYIHICRANARICFVEQTNMCPFCIIHVIYNARRLRYCAAAAQVNLLSSLPIYTRRNETTLFVYDVLHTQHAVSYCS